MRRRVTTLLLAALVLGACATTASEASGGDAETPPLPTIGLGSQTGQISGGADVRALDAEAVESIVMVGDSITTAAIPDLEAQYQSIGFDDVTIVSQPSKRMAVSFGNNTSGANIIEFIANETTDIEPESRLWVVALGTNDISQYNDVDDVVAVIEEVIAPIPDDAPLIWINTYFGQRPEDTAEVNAAIDRVIAARGNATVGRWDQVAPTDGVLLADTVHPNDSGNAVFASLVVTTVANFLQVA